MEQWIGVGLMLSNERLVSHYCNLGAGRLE